MKLRVFRPKPNYWVAHVLDDDGSVLETGPQNHRIGCAIRDCLNKFQRIYGEPSFAQLDISLDEW